MTNNVPQIDLSGLKGLHEGIKPDFWPLAAGWYILGLGLIVCVFLGLYLYKKYQMRPLPYALKELKKIEKAPSQNQLKLLSQLLKRVAFVRYQRKEIAPLSEADWQNFLLASAPDVFTKEQAQTLAFAIYHPKVPDKDLFQSCQKWITQILKKKNPHN